MKPQPTSRGGRLGAIGRVLLVAAVVMCVGWTSTAWADDDAPAPLPWYVPDHATVQFAGNIGMLSAGAGYAYLDDILESELFFGWVPSFLGDRELYMATFKQTVVPYTYEWQKKVEIVPLYAGGFLNYTFGDNYFLTIPDHLDDNYYDRQTALRYGPLIGGRFQVNIVPYGPIRNLAAYWEMNINDLAIDAYVNNPEFFDIYDVATLGLGVRVGFD